MRPALACCVLALAPVLSAGGRIVEVVYPPSHQPGELKFGVTYTAWIPDGVKTLRGVIVHQHGCGAPAAKGGQTAAYDLHWQALARKWDMALLGPYYHVERDDQGCGWSIPTDGSAKAFLQGLTDLAAKSGHPEFYRVPWALWGHSGGGGWSAGMLNLYPERIAAIWFRSGARFSAASAPPAALQVPMMANTGIKEKDDRFARIWTGSLAAFQEFRAKGAPIGFAPDPRTSHECGDSRYAAIPFFDSCLRQRLPPKGSTDQKLRPVSSKGTWLAPLPGTEAKPSRDYTGDPKEAVWLPDETAARAWMEYVRSGSGADRTPPPAPSQVAAKAIDGGGIEITWEAEADFESGIQAFILQRDGKDLKQLPEQPSSQYGRPLFQKMSYHDTPAPPLPEMRFVDTTAAAGSRHQYRVITVNAAGLRSNPSKPASTP